MKRTLVSVAMGAALCGSLLGTNLATASDHDDGVSNLKQMNTNLTDLYVFRKGEEAAGQTADDNGATLVFVMNLNPRSIAGTQYTFNTNARYDFNVSRFMGNPSTEAPSSTISSDGVLRFEFGTANNNQQPITVSYIANGTTESVTKTNNGVPIETTPLLPKGSGVSGTVNNEISLNGQNLKVFAGLRQDTFFFDVQSFFALRTDIADGNGTIAGANLFKNDANAVDFTRNFNVLSIVVEVPRALLQGGTTATTFDVWETISIPQ